MQRRISTESLKIYVCLALFYQDSSDIDVSDHCCSVKRRQAEVVCNIDFRSCLKEGENCFRITLGPRRVQKGCLAAQRASRNVCFVFQEKPHFFGESKICRAV